MRRWILPFTVIILLLSISPVWAGGWSVTTLDELPEHVITGEPLEIGFVVRQHGTHTLEDLNPIVVATHAESDEQIEAEAEEDTPGHYTVELTFPTDGLWNWTISAFGPDQPMPALTVFDAGDVTMMDSESDEDMPALCSERGAALFVAKGCASCHQHADAGFDEYASVNEGPQLTTYEGDPDFLREWIADPVSVKPQTNMPALNLSEDEIEALILFLNADEAVMPANFCAEPE
ncbi:MAG TPA: c-type cytochrome [Aggregatilineaceae bacterium]|nr:c-type cytochrome [Aggregatilineaceae bacterium]